MNEEANTQHTMDRCSLTTELWRGSDVAAVCVRVGPQSHIFLSSASHSSSWPAAHRDQNNIIEEGCGGDDSEAWVIRQSIRLSGSLLPVNHAIQWWVCASERALAVCARQVPIHIYILQCTHELIYIIYAVHMYIIRYYIVITIAVYMS
jgi:hypothetical protein